MSPRFLLPLLALAAPVAAQETRATAAQRFSREFAQSDLNGDGALTPAEVEARMGRMRAGAKRIDPVRVKRLAGLWFGRADADKDGRVTEPEAQTLLTAVFKRYDRNGDGRLGGEDRAAAAAALKARPQGR